VDNQKVVIPNNMIWGDIITNITGTSKRRVDMVFGIGYSDDMAKAQEVLEEILANHDAILKDPAPVVKVHELADSSVNFVVRPWVETENYWDVYWDITRSVKEKFDAAGVSIPFPQQDVHMHQVAST
jgi:small conductance mechanosensitive channel